MAERLLVPKTAEIIVNPIAGNGRNLRVADQAAVRLEQWGWQAEVRETRRAGHETTLAREAAERGTEVVWGVGGDGTLLGIAQGLFETQTALASVSRGNVKVWGRETGTPSDPIGAIDATVGQGKGTIQTIDVGRITTEKDKKDFLLMAGMGYDGTVIHGVHAPGQERKKGGKKVYLESMIKNMFRDEAPTGLLTVDGEEFDVKAFQTWFGNTKILGYFEPRAKDARCDDGRLEVTIFKGPFSRKLPGANALLGLGMVGHDLIRRGKKLPWEQHWQGSKTKLELEKPLPLQIDGDPMHPASTVEVESVPSALRVLVPNKMRTIFSRPGKLLR